MARTAVSFTWQVSFISFLVLHIYICMQTLNGAGLLAIPHIILCCLLCFAECLIASQFYKNIILTGRYSICILWYIYIYIYIYGSIEKNGFEKSKSIHNYRRHGYWDFTRKREFWISNGLMAVNCIVNICIIFYRLQYIPQEIDRKLVWKIVRLAPWLVLPASSLWSLSFMISWYFVICCLCLVILVQVANSIIMFSFFSV